MGWGICIGSVLQFAGENTELHHAQEFEVDHYSLKSECRCLIVGNGGKGRRTVGGGGVGVGGYIDRKAYVYSSCIQEGGEYGGWGDVFLLSE